MLNTIEITIPVLNEEATLKRQIGFIMEHVLELENSDHISIVISDNGSTDKTEIISEELAKFYSGRLRYSRVDKRGVGLALKTSWAKSTADVVGYMDLDLATDISHLNEVIKLFQTTDVDILYGTRLHALSDVKGRKFKREAISRIFNRLLGLYLGTSFSDGMCGFKFLKRKHLLSLINNGANSDGWFFCTELLAVAEWKSLNLYELPVKWNDDPNSKVNILKLTLEYLKAMKKLKFERKAN